DPVGTHLTALDSLRVVGGLGVTEDATITGKLTVDNLDVDGRLDVDEHADIADSTQLGSSFGAADSLAAAAVVNGWIAIDGAYLFKHTLAGTDDSDIIKVPGARPWNTFVFVTSESNSASNAAANNF